MPSSGTPGRRRRGPDRHGPTDPAQWHRTSTRRLRRRGVSLLRRSGSMPGHAPRRRLLRPGRSARSRFARAERRSAAPCAPWGRRTRRQPACPCLPCSCLHCAVEGAHRAPWRFAPTGPCRRCAARLLSGGQLPSCCSFTSFLLPPQLLLPLLLAAAAADSVPELVDESGRCAYSPLSRRIRRSARVRPGRAVFLRLAHLLAEFVCLPGGERGA
jgi:hypothetical protein